MSEREREGERERERETDREREREEERERERERQNNSGGVLCFIATFMAQGTLCGFSVYCLAQVPMLP